MAKRDWSYLQDCSHISVKETETKLGNQNRDLKHTSDKMNEMSATIYKNQRMAFVHQLWKQESNSWIYLDLKWTPFICMNKAIG